MDRDSADAAKLYCTEREEATLSPRDEPNKSRSIAAGLPFIQTPGAAVTHSVL